MRSIPRHWCGPRLLTAVCVAVLSALATPAAVAETLDGRLLDLSIEELMHVEITSASKKTQRVSETAAAVFVITHDDIRRSGARSIPEVLRLAPGIEVAQIDANKWAITARGFNGRFANKLLVLMDGRALYTPSFGGVFWDVQDTVMEDIDRIEIIRGPGGTLWGANAVNGVINIITRQASETQGAELVATAANGPSRGGSLRYGDRLATQVEYRVYAKYLDDAGNEDLQGAGTDDGWHMGRVGARADWAPSTADTLSVTAEAYRGQSGESLERPLLTPPYATHIEAHEDVSGFFTIARWHRQLAEANELQVQTYFDQTKRSGVLFGENRNTAVVDLQYRFPLGGRQDIVAGAGVRYNAYQFSQTQDVSVTPSRPSNVGYNLFVQDELQLIRDRLSFTFGVDFEHNPLSDRSLDALPSGRLLWTLNPDNHVWAAVTKAISTPSYENTAASVNNAGPIAPPGIPQNPFPAPIVTAVEVNPNVTSEKLVGYEIGYRTQLTTHLSFDTTVYLQEYTNLRGEVSTGVYCEPSHIPVQTDPACVIGANHITDLLQFQNAIRGHSSGAEIAADWSPVHELRLRATYTYLHLSLQPTQPGQELANEAQTTEGDSPRHQLSLRADVSLAPTLDLDWGIRHVAALVAVPINAYWSADANFTWRASRNLEVALSGRNLLQKAHVEFVSELADVVPTQIERTVALRLRWTF